MRMFLELNFRGLYYFLTDKSYRSFLFLALRHGGKKRHQMISASVAGYKMKVPDALSFIWQFHEIFYKKSYQFNNDNASPLIFDCGANIGMSCLFFKKNYPQAKIVAFEPDPNLFQTLSENLSNNNIQNVELQNAAVWKENGHLSFGMDGADGGSVTNDKGKKVEVKAIRLKDWIMEQESIDLLKMDIEGAEVEVIQDCREVLHKIKNVFIEYHSFNDQEQHLDVLIQILKENGFRYYLENESFRKIPFTNQRGKHAMDMQVNIFGYKN